MIRPDILDPKKPKKLLALDGGGIRGIISLEVLLEIEKRLRIARNDSTLVLGRYFDYIAGTSTGAIIATGLALGMEVAAIREFYIGSGPEMFDKASWVRRFKYKFEDERLAHKLKAVFGEDTTLGSDRLVTLLMIVLRNATTDSPWSVSNNPRAKYNEESRSDSNLNVPLWQLVRASTAAPTFFPPEVVAVGRRAFVFTDGGVTMYNNPAFQLFIMATLDRYRLQWKTSEDRMLVVSVGTGMAAEANANLAPGDMNLLYNAASIPSALMNAASFEQDLLCRMFGRCRVGDPLDRELGDLLDSTGPVEPRLFTYLRYNGDLSAAGLSELGLDHIAAEHVQRLDSIDYIDELRQVGQAVARRVRVEDFGLFATV
jgi:patatin-like phospholipase/acyl hydrolase